MVTCYLGLGSNLGDRNENIRRAIQKIRALKTTKVIKTSRIIESLPVGGPSGQPKFLNAVTKIRTAIPALKLLKKLKQIETDLGRFKTVRNGPRTIDIDILLYGKKIMRSRELSIPHPRILEREFVYLPLCELIC